MSDTSEIKFSVPGVAKPAGSKRGFAIRRGGSYTGRVAVVDACAGSKDWKADVRAAALAAVEKIPGFKLLTGPVYVMFSFYLPRPKAHTKPNGELRDRSPTWHTKRPDLLKLARGVEDALTGVVWADDSQIASESLYKLYGFKPELYVFIRPLT